MNKIILITGGQRSGKSTYAEQMALSLSDHPVYVATAHIWDDEFRERVRKHQERRGPQWTNIEEERFLSNHDVKGRVVLIDCLTLWATNFFFLAGDDANIYEVLEDIKAEFDRFTANPPTASPLQTFPCDSQTVSTTHAASTTFIFVTNEIGLGGVSANVVQRRFTDLLGWLNQYVASKANEVIMMVSGIPMKIK